MNEGGSQPRWKADGTELFYISRDGYMIAVPLRANRVSFEHGPPQALFTTRFGEPFRNDYAVTSDGQRFLVVHFDEEAASQPITVTLNWTEGLKR